MRDRNAGETTALAFGNERIGRTGFGERFLRTDVQEAVEVAVRLNALEILACEFLGAHFTRGERAGELHDGMKSVVCHILS